jgi:[acyl-carrier-protein] S-malonyltransferase
MGSRLIEQDVLRAGNPSVSARGSARSGAAAGRLGSRAVSDARTAVLFPGQGSQFVGMADPWAGHPASNAVLEEASDAIGRDVVEGCRDDDALATTAFVQPALLAIGVATFRVLAAEGLSPVGVAGHSLGEFSAVVAAGALPLGAALDLVVVRGAAMQRAGEERPGTMTALLGVGSADAEQLADDVRDDDVLVVANHNSPAQVVVSGSVAAIERAEAIARERRIRAVRLQVAGAFHSPLMEPAVEELSSAIDDAPFATPRFPIAENVSGALIADAEELRSLMKRHVVSPVRWESGIRALVDVGADSFLETAPGDVLTKLMKRIAPTATASAVGSPAEAAQTVD